MVSLEGGREVMQHNPTRGNGHNLNAFDVVEDFTNKLSQYAWSDRIHRGDAFVYVRGCWTMGDADNEAFIRALNTLLNRPEIVAEVSLHGISHRTDNNRIPEGPTNDVIDEYVCKVETRRLDPGIDNVWDDVDETRQWYAKQARRGRARFEFEITSDKDTADRVGDCRSRYRIPAEAIGVVPAYDDEYSDQPREHARRTARNNGYRFFEPRVIPDQDDG